MRTKLLIVDDHALMLDSIAAVLSKEDDLSVVGTAASGAQALPLVRRLAPDLVLLDVYMPAMDGFTCLAMIRSRFPAVKVVMLSGEADRGTVERSFKAGASGYIVKSINPRDIASALRQIVDGTFYVAAPSLSPRPRNEADLTDQELAVLKGVAHGLSNRRIGESLWITEKTVKFHLTKIYRKLGVDNRTEAARIAFREGLVLNPLLDPPGETG